MIFWQKKNVVAFCLCPKNLPEAKLKSFVWTDISDREDFKTVLTVSHDY